MERKLFIDMKITSYYLFCVFIALNDGEFLSQNMFEHLKITGCKTSVVLNPKFKQNKTTKSRSEVKAVLIYILAKLHYMFHRVIHLVNAVTEPCCLYLRLMTINWQ